MDQAIEILAVKDQAQHIEFNPLRTRNVALPPGACFVIANSLTEANKAAGKEFNQRVVECRLATKALAKALGVSGWKTLSRLKEVQDSLQLTLPQMLDHG